MKTKSLSLFILLLYTTAVYAQSPLDYVYKTPETYEFTGSNFQDIGASTDHQPGTASFTIAFAMMPKKSANTLQIVAGKGNATSSVSGWTVILGEGYLGVRVCGTSASGNYRASARVPFPDAYLNQMTYVVATVNRATNKIDLYLNGSNNGVVYSGFGPSSNFIDPVQDISSTSHFYLGQRSDAGAKFTGTLSELRLYKRVLSLDEIRSFLPNGLIDLKIEGINNFMFDKQKYLYEGLSTTTEIEEVSFTPTFIGNDITVSLNGTALSSDINSIPIKLNINEEKTILMTVTNSTFSTTETYTFRITRTNQSLKKTAVFTAGQEGYPVYRIPAVIRVANGDLLAFCEGRSSGSDAGSIDIVMKRSTDNGNTWSNLQTIVDFKKLPAENGKTYGEIYGDYTVGNPAPVFDTMDKNYPNGRIFLAFNSDIKGESSVINGTGVREIWVTSSNDNGITWDVPQNITTQVSYPNEPSFNASYTFSQDWRWYAIAPGHAVQLKRSKYGGRLLFPCNHSTPTSSYISHSFYSDDHGETWKLGGDVGNNTNESITAELSNGNVMINCRNYDGTRQRAVASSTDGGITWKNIYRDAQLPEPICQASLLYNDSAKMMLFSNPASTSSRLNMTIRASFDDGKTWSVKRTVDAGTAAYSDLVLQSDKRVGLIYETSGYSMIYASMNDEWILNGERTSSSTTLGITSNLMTNIEIQGNVRNFTFDKNTHMYKVEAPITTESINIIAKAAAGIITINGEIVTSGNASPEIKLEQGKEEYINVTVTETDKTPVNYILKITRDNTATSLNDIKTPTVYCYPNPTEGFVYVRGLKGNSNIHIYDIKGKKIL